MHFHACRGRAHSKNANADLPNLVYRTYKYRQISSHDQYHTNKPSLELKCKPGTKLKIDIWGHQVCQPCNAANREYQDKYEQTKCETCYGVVSENATRCKRGRKRFMSVKFSRNQNQIKSLIHWYHHHWVVSVKTAYGSNSSSR